MHTFPLRVGEVAGSDGKGIGVKEGAQRPGIESRKNKRRGRNDSGVRAWRHPDAGGSIPTKEWVSVLAGAQPSQIVCDRMERSRCDPVTQWRCHVGKE